MSIVGLEPFNVRQVNAPIKNLQTEYQNKPLEANDIADLAETWSKTLNKRGDLAKVIMLSMGLAEAHEESGAQRKQLARQLIDAYIDKNEEQGSLSKDSSKSIASSCINRAIEYLKDASTGLLDTFEPTQPENLHQWTQEQVDLLKKEFSERINDSISGKTFLEMLDKVIPLIQKTYGGIEKHENEAGKIIAQAVAGVVDNVNEEAIAKLVVKTLKMFVLFSKKEIDLKQHDNIIIIENGAEGEKQKQIDFNVKREVISEKEFQLAPLIRQSANQSNESDQNSPIEDSDNKKEDTPHEEEKTKEESKKKEGCFNNCIIQ